MSLTDLLGIALSVYAILNFALLPRLTKTWKANRSLTKISKAGLLAGLQGARNAALVASIVYVCLALVTLTLGFGFGNNITLLEWAVAAASFLHERLESIKNFWEAWFFLVPLALLIYLSWKKQRNELEHRFGQVVDDEYYRLQREREEHPEEWRKLLPDEEMTSMIVQIESLQATLNKLLSTGQSDRQQRKSLRREILQLKEELLEADYQRRVRLDAVDPEQEVPSWRRILLSRGMFSDLKGISEVLSRASLAMLAIALVGLAGTAGASKDMWNRIIKLDDLRVEATTEKVKQEWEQRAKNTPPSKLTSDDQQAIQHLANDFARALVRNPHWRPVNDSVRASSELREGLARRAILRQVNLPEPGGQNSKAFSDGLSPTEQQVLDDVTHGKSEIRLGQVVADREGPAIKAWFGSQWDAVKTSILEHAKQYHEPLKLDELQDSLLDHILSTVLDDAAPPFKYGEIGKEVRSAMNDATQDAIREAVKTEFHRVAEDLADGKPYKKTINDVSHSSIPVSKSKAADLVDVMHKNRMPEPDEFRDHMASSSGSWRDPDQPPASTGGGGGGGFGGPGSTPPNDGTPSGAGNASTVEPESPTSGGAANGLRSVATAQNREAQEIIRDIAKEETENGRYSLPEEAVDALAEYNDHFPQSVAQEAESALGRTLQTYRVASDVGEFAQVAELKVARAASFSMLRGFSRVGGVLIGESPENPQGHADVRDITWQVSGRAVTISFKDGSGRMSSFGPFDISIVHQALAYAADGRPVAVTMTTARPLPQLKIHLHPSLLDTPLGCRVEQLDRLVDTYAGRQLPERGQITEKYEEQLAVYNVAWAERLLLLANAIGEQGNRLKERADSIIQADRDLASLGLKQAGLVDVSSIFKRKPEFFDPAIVSATGSCKQDKLDAFRHCISDQFHSSSAFENRDKDSLGRWFYGHASFMPWSGVRERKFRITNDLSFLRKPDGTSTDQLWPFDFIVQIAFTSPAVNLPEKTRDGYVDQRPVEFDEIKPQIQRLVAEGIQRDGFQPMFDELKQFAVLQRMFRMALKGYLGKQFPAEKLVSLTQETAGAIPYFHTLRWNSSVTSQIEYHLQSAVQSDHTAAWMIEASNQARICSATLARVGVRPLPPEAAQACNLARFERLASSSCPDPENNRAPSCRWKTATSELKVLPDYWREEFAFGVLKDQMQSGGDYRCPSLQPENRIAAVSTAR